MDIQAIIEKEAFQYANINFEQIEFSDAVIDACKANTCGQYGKSWSCPPAVNRNGYFIDCNTTTHSKGIVYTTLHKLEDSFDIESMIAGKISHRALDDKIADEVRKSGGILLSVGGCILCEKCTCPTQPCRFPDKIIPSLESQGIDVVTLSKSANINYHNGVNTVTYFSVVLFRD